MYDVVTLSSHSIFSHHFTSRGRERIIAVAAVCAVKMVNGPPSDREVAAWNLRDYPEQKAPRRQKGPPPPMQVHISLVDPINPKVMTPHLSMEDQRYLSSATPREALTYPSNWSTGNASNRLGHEVEYDQTPEFIKTDAHLRKLEQWRRRRHATANVVHVHPNAANKSWGDDGTHVPFRLMDSRSASVRSTDSAECAPLPSVPATRVIERPQWVNPSDSQATQTETPLEDEEYFSSRLQSSIMHATDRNNRVVAVGAEKTYQQDNEDQPRKDLWGISSQTQPSASTATLDRPRTTLSKTTNDPDMEPPTFQIRLTDVVRPRVAQESVIQDPSRNENNPVSQSSQITHADTWSGPEKQPPPPQQQQQQQHLIVALEQQQEEMMKIILAQQEQIEHLRLTRAAASSQQSQSSSAEEELPYHSPYAPFVLPSPLPPAHANSFPENPTAVVPLLQQGSNIGAVGQLNTKDFVVAEQTHQKERPALPRRIEVESSGSGRDTHRRHVGIGTDIQREKEDHFDTQQSMRLAEQLNTKCVVAPTGLKGSVLLKKMHVDLPEHALVEGIASLDNSAHELRILKDRMNESAIEQRKEISRRLSRHLALGKRTGGESAGVSTNTSSRSVSATSRCDEPRLDESIPTTPPPLTTSQHTLGSMRRGLPATYGGAAALLDDPQFTSIVPRERLSHDAVPVFNPNLFAVHRYAEPSPAAVALPSPQSSSSIAPSRERHVDIGVGDSLAVSTTAAAQTDDDESTVHNKPPPPSAAQHSRADPMSTFLALREEYLSLRSKSSTSGRSRTPPFAANISREEWRRV